VLRFRLGPFPVAIEPWFWITAVMLSGLGGDFLRILIWVAVVFVSVLVHELGHAVVARALGGRPEIVLRAFGGVTLPLLRRRPGALQEIALSIAGPIFGLSMYAVAWAVMTFAEPQTGTPLWLAARLLAYTSLAWTVLNLLPVLPLDGGHVLQAALTGIRKKDSLRLAAGISMVVAGAIAAYLLIVSRSFFMGIFFALFAGQNYSIFRGTRAEPQEAAEEPQGPGAVEHADVARLTEVARRALAAGDVQGALAAAELLESSDGPYRQAAGQRIRAGIALAQGSLDEAGRTAGRSYSLWPTPDAAVVAARANLRAGDRDSALTWLRRAVDAGAPADAVRADAELGPLVA
jgi:Zn-dependent protease